MGVAFGTEGPLQGPYGHRHSPPKPYVIIVVLFVVC